MHRETLSTCPFEGIIRQISFVVVVGLLSVSIALGQSVGGRVSGRSTDPSGAVVPAVRISAQNTSTNVVSATQSDGSGYYTLQLPSGNYTITESATGFGTLVQQNITVTVGGDVGLDFHLQVASSATSVEVHAEASPLINPNTSSVQTSVDNSLVSTIPVAISGSMRNASSFLQLEPGYNSTALSLNGGAFGDQPVTVDGADVSAVGFGSGQGSASWAATVPSFAVQEFQVVGSNPDADVGRTSTGAVKYLLKSGTNQLHGSVFEYLRNTVFDARSFFQPKRGVNNQNEFGFELGGPIRRDKTFFYGYYDGFRYATSNTGVFYSLLTPGMKAGDFTAAGIPAIYDPSTTVSNGSGGFMRQQFSCNGVLNKICPSAISPVSTYFASLFPNPTLPGLTNNFQGTTTSNSTTNEPLLKIDQVLSPTSRLSVSASWEGVLNLSNCPFGPALCAGSYSPFTGTREIINWDKTVSPNKGNYILESLSCQRLVNLGYHGLNFFASQCAIPSAVAVALAPLLTR
jgi:Carboxypeptidase regulatory-like domain